MAPQRAGHFSGVPRLALTFTSICILFQQTALGLFSYKRNIDSDFKSNTIDLYSSRKHCHLDPSCPEGSGTPAETAACTDPQNKITDEGPQGVAIPPAPVT